MNRMIKFTAFATLLVIFASCKESVTPTLDVEGGKIEGIELDNSVVYRGIPYAAPPVGELRWKAPQPVVPWATFVGQSLSLLPTGRALANVIILAMPLFRQSTTLTMVSMARSSMPRMPR